MNNLRPLFHFSCPQGWCNDPNGFSFFNGTFHLYFQHNPNDTKWGPMHWGHATSNNLLTWKYLPIALFPDTAQDNQGCFSGTALQEKDKQILIYTGVTKNAQNSDKLIQQQCLAYYDGKNFTKDLQNPVIKTSDVQVEFLQTDFRDPKIWIDGKNYFCICVIQKKDLNGALALFSSKDLHSWQFKNVIAQSNGELGGMWECPDYFELNKKDIIILSPQSIKENAINIQRGFHNGNNSVYMTGIFDKINFVFTPENRVENNFYAAQIDYGIDFYAPQTTLSPDGRRIMIAWLQAWESYLTPENFSWSGMMTLPRELLLVDNCLVQKPVQEYEEKVSKLQFIKGEILQNATTFEPLIFENENFLAFDLELTINPTELKKVQNATDSTNSNTASTANADQANSTATPQNAQQIIFTICDDKNQFVKFTYTFLTKTKDNIFTNELFFDRSHSTNDGGAINTRKVTVLQSKNDTLSLRFICDTYSSETFINGGKTVFTNAFFLSTTSRKLKIQSTCSCNIQYKLTNLTFAFD